MVSFRSLFGRFMQSSLDATDLRILRLLQHDASLSAADADRALWGNLLVFGAVVCEAAYIVIGKRLTADISPKRIAAVINLIGFAQKVNNEVGASAKMLVRFNVHQFASVGTTGI